MVHPTEPEPDSPVPPAEPPTEPGEPPIHEPHRDPAQIALAARRRVGIVLH